MFAPELLPHLNNPVEVQDLRKLDDADKKDIEEWVATAVEVLPEIHHDPILLQAAQAQALYGTPMKLNHEITHIQNDELSCLFAS